MAWIITPALVIIAVMATATTYALAHASSAARGAAGLSAAGRGDGQRAALAGQATGTTPLRVLSVSPAPGARGTDGSQPVVVTFSAPLAAGSPVPSLKPAVRGSWHQAGASLAFRPAAAFGPSRRFTVRVPAGPGGVRSASGASLARPVVAAFRTRAWSTRRLSELLAQLRYLPLSWSPLGAGPGRHPGPAAGAAAGTSAGTGAAGTGAAGTATSGSGIAAQIVAAYSPPAGTFRWHHGYPASLRRHWQAARPSLILKGAVMAFESQHGMTMNGIAGPAVWNAVFRAAQDGRANPSGYTYALASKADPETLTIWHDGHIVLRSAANTGIPVAPTTDGTFPVYLRYRFQIMRGLNPDGSSYADPVSFVSYFHAGEAVHYFPRGSYGFPQSLGCVELPIGAAAQAWPYLTYGSLVTVAG
jgi:peptidoglycan hydrolase-like protein with peptidoglycan-binding domain